MRLSAITQAVAPLFHCEISDTEKSILAGMAAIERRRQAETLAQPMRRMFDVLDAGEVHVVCDRAVMHMPELDSALRTVESDWVEIAPAIRGWIDCWARIDSSISTYRMGVLADRLERDQEITPRLVEQARDEFERTIARIPEVDEGKIRSAITTTQIAWEVERMGVAG